MKVTAANRPRGNGQAESYVKKWKSSMRNLMLENDMCKVLMKKDIKPK